MLKLKCVNSETDLILEMPYCLQGLNLDIYDSIIQFLCGIHEIFSLGCCCKFLSRVFHTKRALRLVSHSNLRIKLREFGFVGTSFLKHFLGKYSYGIGGSFVLSCLTDLNVGNGVSSFTWEETDIDIYIENSSSACVNESFRRFCEVENTLIWTEYFETDYSSLLEDEVGRAHSFLWSTDVATNAIGSVTTFEVLHPESYPHPDHDSECASSPTVSTKTILVSGLNQSVVENDIFRGLGGGDKITSVKVLRHAVS